MTHILTMAQTFLQQNHDREKQRQLEREQERQQRQKTDRGISR